MDVVGVMAAYLPMVRVYTALSRQALECLSSVCILLQVIFFLILLPLYQNYVVPNRPFALPVNSKVRGGFISSS